MHGERCGILTGNILWTWKSTHRSEFIGRILEYALTLTVVALVPEEELVEMAYEC